MHDVSVVTITHNRSGYAAALIESLQSSSVRPREIIVVDNASTDGTSEYITRHFPDVVVIRNAHNYFVSRACNIGLRRASGKYVLIIADDNVVDPRCLEELSRCFETHDDAGIVAPVMYFFDDPDRVWHLAAKTNLWTGFTKFLKSSDAGAGDVIETRSGVPNCFMIRKDIVEAIGGLDADLFPFHHEETDYFLRLRKAGYKAYVCKRAKDWHRTPLPKTRVVIGSADFSVDNPTRAYFHARARSLLVRQHGSLLQQACYFSSFFWITALGYTLISFFGARRGTRLNTAGAFLRGSFVGAVMRLPGTPVSQVLADSQGVFKIR